MVKLVLGFLWSS